MTEPEVIRYYAEQGGNDKAVFITQAAKDELQVQAMKDKENVGQPSWWLTHKGHFYQVTCTAHYTVEGNSQQLIKETELNKFCTTNGKKQQIW